MNIKILARALQKVIDAHEKTGTSSALQKISSDATNGVNNASHQTAYVDGKESLLEKLKSVGSLDIFDYEIFLLEETGLAYLLPYNVANKIVSIAQADKLTLAVVGTNLLEFKNTIEKSLKNAKSMIASMNTLGIEPLEFDQGNAAIAISIPSNVYQDDLKKLGKKFVEVEKIVHQIVNFTTGQTQEVKIIAISNTSASLIMGLALAAADRFSVILERLSNSAVNYQESKLKALEYRRQKDDYDDAMKGRLESSATEQEKIAEDILNLKIQAIVVEMNKSKVENSELGLIKALKELVAQINHGIDYDVLAIPYEVEEDHEADEEDQIISKINSRTDREMMKMIRKIEPKLISHKKADDKE